MVDVLELDAGQRAIVDGLRGRRVGWLAADGVVGTSDYPLGVDVVEVPRCEIKVAYEALLVSSLEDVVESVAAAEPNFTVVRVVRWPPTFVGGEPVFGEQVGVLLAD